MEPKRVIFSFFWNFFTLSQKFYTHGAHDKYQVGERTYWVSALILQKPHICRSLGRALYNNNTSHKDSQKDFAAGCVPSHQFHSVPFHGRTEIKSVSVWVWGVGGRVTVCGCLTAKVPAQDHFANGIAIELAPPTNKHIYGLDTCWWKVLSDKIWSGIGSDWFIIALLQNSFFTLLLIALWQPLIDVWANICKSTRKQTHSYKLDTAHEIILEYKT